MYKWVVYKLYAVVLCYDHWEEWGDVAKKEKRSERLHFKFIFCEGKSGLLGWSRPNSVTANGIDGNEKKLILK